MAIKPVCHSEHAYLFSRKFYQFYPYYANATVCCVISATHFNLMLVDKKVRSEVYYTVGYIIIPSTINSQMNLVLLACQDCSGGKKFSNLSHFHGPNEYKIKVCVNCKLYKLFPNEIFTVLRNCQTQEKLILV